MSTDYCKVTSCSQKIPKHHIGMRGTTGTETCYGTHVHTADDITRPASAARDGLGAVLSVSMILAACCYNRMSVRLQPFQQAETECGRSNWKIERALELSAICCSANQDPAFVPTNLLQAPPPFTGLLRIG